MSAGLTREMVQALSPNYFEDTVIPWIKAQSGAKFLHQTSPQVMPDGCKSLIMVVVERGEYFDVLGRIEMRTSMPYVVLYRNE